MVRVRVRLCVVDADEPWHAAQQVDRLGARVDHAPTRRLHGGYGRCGRNGRYGWYGWYGRYVRFVGVVGIVGMAGWKVW